MTDIYRTKSYLPPPPPPPPHTHTHTHTHTQTHTVTAKCQLNTVWKFSILMLMYVRDNTVNVSGAYLMNCNKPIYRAAWETMTPNRRGLGNYDAVVLWRYVTAHALYWPGIVGSKSKVSMVSHVRCLKPQIFSASKANIKDIRLKVYFLSSVRF